MAKHKNAPKHTKDELSLLQSLPLDIKVMKTIARINEFVRYYGQDECAVSFSGGKDSTVLLHIARQLYPNIEAVFVDTGLEYPEIREFVKGFGNVQWVHPKKNFRQVITEYGYPFIGKEVSERVENARKCITIMNNGGGTNTSSTITALQKNFPIKAQQLLGIGGFFSKRYDFSRYKDLLNVDFRMSSKCCNVMKKQPSHTTHKKRIVATMTEESELRRIRWLQYGCNSFEENARSAPMSFWKEQDVLEYIKKHDLPIASVYGDIVYEDKNGNKYDMVIGDQCPKDCKLCTTGCKRTGCMFCGFGAHMEKKGEGRFERMKITHPKLYDYCLGGGEYDDEGYWIPNAKGLGMAHCIDELNKLYSKKGKPFISY